MEGSMSGWKEDGWIDRWMELEGLTDFGMNG